MPRLLLPAVALSLLSASSVLAALPDPLFATYWGQSTESSLSTYCDTGYFNVISIGFVSGFGATDFAFSTDGCTATATSGSCASLGAQITKCQAAGVKILISYGGATKFDCGSSGCTGDYYFATEAQATTTATQAWEMFFNGGKTTSGVARPFGSVVLDGIDLDIEMTATGDGQEPQLHYDTFVNTLKGLDSSLTVSASPECQYGSLGSNPMAAVVTTAEIDFFFVQFFNNAKCNVASANFAATFEFWTTQAAANPSGKTQVLMGLPGNTAAALLPMYYITPAEALGNVSALRAKYPNAYVGVGVYDAASSIGSTASGSDPNWAQTVAKGLKNLPAVVASSSSVGTVSARSSLPAVAGNATATGASSLKSGATAVSTNANAAASVSAAAKSSGAAAASSSSAGGTSAAPGGAGMSVWIGSLALAAGLACLA